MNLKGGRDGASFIEPMALYIIKQYPLQYARYFLWPNINNYYTLPVEFLQYIIQVMTMFGLIAQKWFGYKGAAKLITRTKDFRVRILDFYPILSGIINVVMLCCLWCFIMLNGFRMNMLFGRGVLMAGVFWLLKCSVYYSLFGSSVTLSSLSYFAHYHFYIVNNRLVVEDGALVKKMRVAQ